MTFPIAYSFEDIKNNLALVEQKIQAACIKAGRDPKEVRLLPVSKTIEQERIEYAYRAGVKVFGENKVQEAYQKSILFEHHPDMKWAVIGHLQSNKAKLVASFASEFHALDRHSVASILDRELQKLGKSLDVYIQVNTSNEQSKYGLHPNDTLKFARELSVYSSLNVKGLMTLALFSDDHNLVRPCFVKLRELRDQIKSEGLFGNEFGELSMGMSGDYEMAIEEGATVVRVGQMIFGKRATPDSNYWPGMGTTNV
jgi:pyridoxal phosphate enzyme (YggS family)